MSSKRRSFSKKRTYPYKRRYGSKRGPSTKSLSKKIRHIENDLIELKSFRANVVADPIGEVTSYYLCLNDIGQGTQSDMREGNQVTVVGLQMRFWISVPIGQLDPTIVRIIIFWDRQANGVLPAMTSSDGTNPLLDLSYGGPTPLIAFYDQNTRERYKVVYDKTFTMANTVVRSTTEGATTQASSTALYKSIHLKTKRQVKYETDNDIPTTNALWIAAFSNVTGGDEQPVMRMNFQTFYKDA